MGIFINILVGGAVAGGVMVGYRRYIESTKKLPPGAHVVIVGAGYGGVSLADKIHGKGDYTLIDSRECLHHNMAALRAAVKPGFVNKTFVPYSPKFGEHFKQGRVTAIDTSNNTVTLDGQSEPIPYTHLVIATGSTTPFPGKCDPFKPVSELYHQYSEYVHTVQKAKKIVIVGGGAVGVELAAEIAYYYPDKSVTIVNNRDVLVSPKLAEKALTGIEERLEKMNITVVKGDTVSNLDRLPLNILQEGLLVRTSGGKQLEADLVIPCMGIRVNSGAYENSLPEKMTNRGALMVDEQLKVKGLDNVYAIGDCNDLPVAKLAMESAFQAWHVCENLVTKTDPKPYKIGDFRMVVPLGADGGIAQNGTKVLGDRAARWIKAKDVFVKMIWKNMGQKVPKDSTE